MPLMVPIATNMGMGSLMHKYFFSKHTLAFNDFFTKEVVIRNMGIVLGSSKSIVQRVLVTFNSDT